MFLALFSEFKPALRFLGKFLVIYIVGNLVYGLFVSSYIDKPDPITIWVSEQSVQVLNQFGWSVESVNSSTKSTTHVIFDDRKIMSVFEGCNGINVMIIFAGFVFAYDGSRRSMLWFLPLGLLLIHLSNLLRLVLLFIVSIDFPNYLYFTHKYLFTAAIYFVTFLLWIWWISRFGNNTKPTWI